ncbi:MAG: hypothetical protein AAGA12_02240 [Pseudomonadota bacterium]
MSEQRYSAPVQEPSSKDVKAVTSQLRSEQWERRLERAREQRAIVLAERAALLAANVPEEPVEPVPVAAPVVAVAQNPAPQPAIAPQHKRRRRFVAGIFAGVAAILLLPVAASLMSTQAVEVSAMPVPRPLPASDIVVTTELGALEAGPFKGQTDLAPTIPGLDQSDSMTLGIAALDAPLAQPDVALPNLESPRSLASPQIVTELNFALLTSTELPGSVELAAVPDARRPSVQLALLPQPALASAVPELTNSVMPVFIAAAPQLERLNAELQVAALPLILSDVVDVAYTPGQDIEGVAVPGAQTRLAPSRSGVSDVNFAPEIFRVPTTKTLPQPKLFVLYLPNQTPDADKDASRALLTSYGLTLDETVEVQITISKPHLRVYHRQDFEVGQELADELGLELRPMLNLSNPPPRGSVQYWAAGRGGAGQTRPAARVRQARQATPRRAATAQRAPAARAPARSSGSGLVVVPLGGYVPGALPGIIVQN